MLTQEEFVQKVAEQRYGIQLDENKRRFLELIRKDGVCVRMTQEGRESREFQELVTLLEQMHKNGTIPSFQIIEV